LLHRGILLDFLYELYYDAQIHKHQTCSKPMFRFVGHLALENKNTKT